MVAKLVLGTSSAIVIMLLSFIAYSNNTTAITDTTAQVRTSTFTTTQLQRQTSVQTRTTVQTETLTTTATTATTFTTMTTIFSSSSASSSSDSGFLITITCKNCTSMYVVQGQTNYQWHLYIRATDSVSETAGNDTYVVYYSSGPVVAQVNRVCADNGSMSLAVLSGGVVIFNQTEVGQQGHAGGQPPECTITWES